MMTLGLILAGALSAPLDDIQYQRMVEVLKVQVTPSKEPRRHDLDITFNLVPDMPKGTMIFFELERNMIPVTDDSSVPVNFPFTLENDNRKNIKIHWTPKARLTCDKYMVKTSIPLAEQSEEAKKGIQANTKRFPEGYKPWPWLHSYMEFAVGNPEQEAAEYKEVKAFVEGKVGEVLALNNEATAELEKVISGQAHVNKAGKLEADSLTKFMAGWMGRTAKVQTSIGEVLVIDPGLYDTTKYQKIHANLLALSKLIGKRIFKTELKKVTDKYGVAASALKLPAVSGFRTDYTYGTSAAEIIKKQKELTRDLWYAAPGRKLDELYPDPDEKPAEPASEPKDAKKDEPKDAGDSPKAGEEGSKGEEPAKPDTAPKKDPKKGKKDTKKKK